MIWVAGLRREHPDEVAATLRQSFGCSWRDFRDPDTWPELVSLVRVAVKDTRTYLGARIAGFAYPAAIPDLVQVAHMAGEHSPDLLPGGMQERYDREHVDVDEQAEAMEKLARFSAFRQQL